MIRIRRRTAGTIRPRTLGVSLAAFVAIVGSSASGRVAMVQDVAPTPVTDWRAEVAPDILASIATPLESVVREEAPRLAALYAPGGGRALWIDAAGSRTADARATLDLLAAASDDGLEPADYDVQALSTLGAGPDAAAPPDRARLAAFDLRLSAATLRYLRHLHLGRVDPRRLGVRLTEPEPHDFVALLRTALAGHDVPALGERLAPQLPQYQALRRQLARYRSIDEPADAAWPMPAHSLHAGDPFAAAGALRRRLAALGDLPADVGSAEVAAVYDDALAAAVQRFQARHGLSADGVLGRATADALAVPARMRLRQIELALERLRWLPDLGDERVVALNIPMFRLATWDGAGSAGPSLRMRAIVGKAVITETPVFTALMRSVTFRPYWNVPRSILLKELLPELERDPARMRRFDLEIVDGDRDESAVVPATPEAFAGLRAGALRLRQRPGPANSLGLVKFDFPNDAGVYMHGTPATELFERSRRDFSHGCVRVEDPALLAVWALRGEDGWDGARVDAAMRATTTLRVALSRPIRVILFYTTAAVAEDGTVYFADDIYGHDATLARALARLGRPS